MYEYKYDDTLIIQAALAKIGRELDRIYWNKFQKQLPSPFENTGISYHNNVFSVKAYDWNDNVDPSFTYKNLKVWWYKYLTRGTYAECDHEMTARELNDMILECCDSIEKYLEEDFNGE